MKNILLYVYAWSMAMFFGAVLSETVILYPNIFHDVPASLETAMKFLTVIGPGQFFPRLGGGIMLVAIITIASNLKNKPAIYYLLLSFVLMALLEFLFSVFYFWPRNKIMFTEGTAMHSAETLKTVAAEFQAGHIVRLSCSFITSCLAFIGLYQTTITRGKTAINSKIIL